MALEGTLEAALEVAFVALEVAFVALEENTVASSVASGSLAPFEALVVAYSALVARVAWEACMDPSIVALGVTLAVTLAAVEVLVAEESLAADMVVALDMVLVHSAESVAEQTPY